MAKCVQNFQADLKKLRTGRAHPSLIEHLKVDYYGSDVPLQQVASIAVEDGRTLVVSPWEKTVVQAIEKAILKSDLGLTPMTAGTVIRIPMPPLTEERRREITKVVRQDAGERARRGAQRAPRRHDGRQGSAEGEDDLPGRRAARGRTTSRSSPTSTSPTSTSCSRPRKRKSCRSDGRKRTPRTSRSSWTATAAGPRRAACPARRATRRASTPVRSVSRSAAGSGSRR